MSFRLRIFAFILISVAFAVLVVSLISYQILRTNIRSSTFEQLTQLRSSKTQLLDTYFLNLHSHLETLAGSGPVERILNTPPQGFSKLNGIDNADVAYLEQIAQVIEIHDLFILNNKGQVLLSTSRSVSPGMTVDSKAPSAHGLAEVVGWGSRLDESMHMFFDFQYSETASSLAQRAYFATRVLKAEKQIGLIVLQLSPKELDRLVGDSSSYNDRSLGYSGELLIHGSDGYLRNSPRRYIKNSNVKISFDKESMQRLEEKDELQEESLDYLNNEVLRSVGKVYLPNGKLWYVTAKLNSSEAFASVRKLFLASLAAAVSVLIIFFLIAYIASGQVVAPISLLSDYLDIISKRRQLPKVPYASNDEIGMLFKKFHQLADSLEKTTVSKEFIDSVLQSIREFLFIVRVIPGKRNESARYIIVEANESALHTLGLSKAQIKDYDFKDLISTEELFEDPYWLLEGRHSLEGELMGRHQRTPILMNWSLLPHQEQNEFLLVFICTDISERRQQELSLIKAREDAISASQAKTDFLAKMSHEIRTPLNSIIGITDVLKESTLPKEQEHLVNLIYKAGENLLALINDILDISKIEARELKVEQIDADLHELVIDTCDILKPKAYDKKLEFRIDYRLPTPTFVQTDPTRVRQILLNLIGNAIKFTEKGDVTIQVDMFTNFQNDKFLQFAIIDTGPGIPEDKHKFLFKNFTQADNSITRRFGGTGLGLAISKNLVELMGGQIWFLSKPGQGTSFYFRLPYVPGAAKRDEPKNRVSQAQVVTLGERPMEVLIVDDTEDNRFLVKAFLKDFNARIDEAENGLIAVKMAEEKSYDFIFMDIQMPVLDGYEATRLIRENENTNQLYKSVIFALSANAMPDDIKKSMEAGCDEHLTKPIKKATLLNALSQRLSRQKLAS